MSTQDELNLISKQLHIYLGLFILITGIIGGILNIIIFTTLKTFRETTSGFYLTILSIVNILQLSIALFLRILSEGFSVDLKKTTIGCKIQIYAAAVSVLTSETIMCLATIDKYISMSKKRQYSNKRIVKRATIFTCIFWGLYGINLAVLYNAPTGVCMTTNSIFLMYITRFYIPILLGFLPLSIMTIFSLLAFNSARTLASRQVNIIYLTRDRQLTAMTLVHAIYVIITSLPYIIYFTYSLSRAYTNPEQIARNNLNSTITVLIYYSSFTSSFYIYCCVSERFRKQLLYVLTKICISRQQQLTNNQIVPHTEIIAHIQSQDTKLATVLI